MKKRLSIAVSILIFLLVPLVWAVETQSDPYFKYMVGIALVLLLIVFLINPKRRKQKSLLVESIENKPELHESIQEEVQEVKNREVQKIYNEENIYVLNPEPQTQQGYREHAVTVREEEI